MCTPISQSPFSSLRIERASSKSLASVGSIVNVGIPRKSRRLLYSSSAILSLIALAVSSTSCEKLYGNSNSARIACISVSCKPGKPRTSITSPIGFFVPEGHSTIFATAFWPFSAPFKLRIGINISKGICLPPGTRNAKFFDISIIPTKVVRARSIISTTSPSGRDFFRFANK